MPHMTEQMEHAKIALYKLYKASLVLGNGGTGTWMTV